VLQLGELPEGLVACSIHQDYYLLNRSGCNTKYPYLNPIVNKLFNIFFYHQIVNNKILAF
jgi:hypothetical protein